MHAYVYKSQRRADTYVYLAARDDFARLPEPLRTQLGPLAFVLDVELTPERGLAREGEKTRSGGTAACVSERPPAVLAGRKAIVIRENLVLRGFHLQFPPSIAGAPLHEDMFGKGWGTDA